MSVPDSYELTFIWPYGASEVLVTGTFDQWTKSVLLSSTPTGFEARVAVPWDSKILYKFVVDGLWKYLDGEPTETDNQGNVNNVCYTPAKPTDLATTSPGKVLSPPGSAPPPTAHTSTAPNTKGGHPGSHDSSSAKRRFISRAFLEGIVDLGLLKQANEEAERKKKLKQEQKLAEHEEDDDLNVAERQFLERALLEGVVDLGLLEKANQAAQQHKQQKPKHEHEHGHGHGHDQYKHTHEHKHGFAHDLKHELGHEVTHVEHKISHAAAKIFGTSSNDVDNGDEQLRSAERQFLNRALLEGVVDLGLLEKANQEAQQRKQKKHEHEHERASADAVDDDLNIAERQFLERALLEGVVDLGLLEKANQEAQQRKQKKHGHGHEQHHKQHPNDAGGVGSNDAEHQFEQKALGEGVVDLGLLEEANEEAQRKHMEKQHAHAHEHNKHETADDAAKKFEARALSEGVVDLQLLSEVDRQK